MKNFIFLLCFSFLFAFSSKAQLTILSSLDEFPEAGHAPHNKVIIVDHYLYTTARNGGIRNYGTILRYDLYRDSLENLFIFSDTTGYYPMGSVIHVNGYLYGMTNRGGFLDIGTAYRFNLNDSTFTTLFDFSGQGGNNPGSYPEANFIKVGNYLYGMTQAGGNNIRGNIFRINLNDLTYENIYDFNGTDGDGPWRDLYYDGTYLYGTTSKGGVVDSGVIFRFNLTDSTYEKIHDFRQSTGAWPYCTLIEYNNALYGTTFYGGSDGQGVLFKIDKDGNNYTVLHHFTYLQGGHPAEGVTLVDNALYGTLTSGGPNGKGGIFKYDLTTNTFHIIYSFEKIIGSESKLTYYNNYLYGTSYSGGENNTSFGTIHRLQLKFPEIEITDQSNNIPDSSIIDFGIIPVNATKDITLSINNIANDAVLNIWNVSLKYDTAFHIAQNPASVIDPSGTSTLTISFSPSQAQTYTDTLIIRNDDQDENPFVIILRGQAQTTTNISENNAPVRIFPNPCHDHFYIQAASPVNITILSITGQKVRDQNLTGQVKKIDITDLQPGAYIIKIKTSTGIITKKIIKQ